MKISRVDVGDESLRNPDDPIWSRVATEQFPLVPTPLNGNAMIKKISPFIEKSTDHGVITALEAAAVHNGNIVAVRLSWAGDQHSKIADLDEFVDGAAVMFPLTDKASAFTMGSPSDPVNAWYWKANLQGQGFDVIAHGYGTSARHTSNEIPIMSNAIHTSGRWNLVLSRSMGKTEARASFPAGGATRMAFAIWDGGNRERAGRKSFSGDFIPAPIDP